MSHIETPQEQYVDFSLRVHGAAGEQRRITNAQIELTYGCNLHCMHCYTDCYNDPELIKRELTVPEFERIFDELRDLGVLWLGLTGGEAFLHPEFRTIYLAAKSRGFIVTVLSNATTITDDLADFLVEYPPFQVDLSCHGATAATFEAVTQVPGSFALFVAGVERLRARGIPYKIKTKAMTLNKDELPAIKTFVESLGVPFSVNGTIYPRLNGDLAPTTLRLPPTTIAQLDDDDDRCNEGEPPASLDELQPPTSDRLYRCGCGNWSVHINAWGELGACTFFKEPRVSVRTHTVAEALEECFAQIHAAKYTSDSPCATCRVHTFCDKMPAAAWAEVPGGDLEQPVPDLCETAFAKASRHTGVTLESPIT